MMAEERGWPVTMEHEPEWLSSSESSGEQATCRRGSWRHVLELLESEESVFDREGYSWWRLWGGRVEGGCMLV